jgi:hypothetical protein
MAQAACQLLPQDLVEEIEWTSVECLNQDDSFPAENALKSGLRDQDQMLLKSDADEQLLLTVPFKQLVKLHSMRVVAPVGDTAPRKLKLFVNAPSMGFEDAESRKAAQEIELTAEQLAGDKPFPLNYVKFQRVSQVTLFFEDNASGGDEDVTDVARIDLLGFTVETTNMKEFKKVG